MNRYFNPRTPVGCDRDVSDDNTLQNISIHAPQWGATRARLRYVRRVQYFNPRTPVGCDWAVRFNVLARLVISIHAPQWGATVENTVFGRSQRISIHAPQWGATRHPRKKDLLGKISIHAPQWGATHTPR